MRGSSSRRSRTALLTSYPALACASSPPLPPSLPPPSSCPPRRSSFSPPLHCTASLHRFTARLHCTASLHGCRRGSGPGQLWRGVPRQLARAVRGRQGHLLRAAARGAGVLRGQAHDERRLPPPAPAARAGVHEPNPHRQQQTEPGMGGREGWGGGGQGREAGLAGAGRSWRELGRAGASWGGCPHHASIHHSQLARVDVNAAVSGGGAGDHVG